MKQLVLKIKNCNWSMMEPGEWNNTEWKIYDDLTIAVSEVYNGSEIENVSNLNEFILKLSKKEYDTILNNIELAKNSTTKVGGCDGDAWEFIQYQNGTEIWKRELSYIYGIQPLENIASLFKKIKYS